MALVPDQKFSTFQSGGTPTTGDIIVGLRGGINTKFNWVLPSGVDAITGTANQVLVNGSSGVPVTGNATLSAPQDIATTSNPTFNNLQLTGVILGSIGNTVIGLSDTIGAVNYVRLSNNITGNGVNVGAQGLDANVALNLTAKGTAPIGLITGALTQPLFIYNGTSNQHLTRFNMSNTAADRSVTFQDASGTLAFLADIPSGSPSALTRTNDTNVTITLGGTPTTALLQAVSLTMGWNGLLSPVRGGTGINNGTNTLTLAGNLATSGAFASTFTMTGATAVTFPTSGTLATTSQITPQLTTLVTTTPYNVLVTDDIVLVDTATIGAPSSIILPAAPTRDGQVWTIKDWGLDASTYHITISVSGGGTIDGNTTYTLADDDSAVSIAWSSSQSEYTVLSSFNTLIPVLRISGNSGTAVPNIGIITINGGTTGLTTAASSSTLSLTGILIGANGGTGVNNGARTFTMGGNVTFSGAFTFAGTITGNTAVTFPTSGTLATTSQLVTPAALTKTDDTNVTLTLGGSPSTALVNAASLTLGWTGQLAVSRGGTGISSFGTGVATALGQNVNGSGAIALTTSPTFVTPVLGVAAATSINFGGSTLSNYVDGTFTPTMTCSSPGDLSVAYANQTGVYQRIGNMVFVNVRIQFTPTFTTASGQVQFAGFPIPCQVTNGIGWAGSVGFFSGASSWPVGATSLSVLVESGASFCSLTALGSAVGSSSLQMSGLATGVQYQLVFTAVYHA